MNTHARTFKIGVLSNPSQLAAALMAVGYIAFRFYFMPPIDEGLSLPPTFLEILLSESVFIVAASIAVICIFAPVKFMFLTTVPILYVLVYGITTAFITWDNSGGFPEDIIIMALIPLVILSIAVSSVIGTATYNFKNKNGHYFSLAFMLAIFIAIPAFEYYQRSGMPVNLDILATLLFYAAMVVAVRAIASGKREGIPKHDIVHIHNHPPEQLGKINNSDFIPVVEYSILESMSKEFESDFGEDYFLRSVNKQDIWRGLFAMDSLANKDKELPSDGLRSLAISQWAKNQYRVLMKQGVFYKILNPLMWIVCIAFLFISVATMPAVRIPHLALYIDIEPFSSMHLLAFIIGILAFPPISMSILNNFYRKPGNPVESGITPRSEVEFARFAVHGDSKKWLLSEFKGIETQLNKICAALGVDPANFKENLGRQTGGGSTYYGWGSSRAVGWGIIFTMFSQGNAEAKNKKVNDKVEAVETLLFYNNLAVHFYKNVFPDCEALDLLAFVPIKADEP